MTTLYEVNHETVHDAQKYQQSLSSQDEHVSSISRLLIDEQSIGLAMRVEGLFLSFISVIIVFFIWIDRNVLLHSRNVRSDWRLFRVSADIYMFSLVSSDILQVIGGTLNIRWAHNEIVTIRPYHTVHGFIAQFGQLGLGLSTLILAVHTFVGALRRVGLKSLAYGLAASGITLVGLIWIFSALRVGVGTGIHENYETPGTPISPRYPGERLAGEYIWLWLALFTSLLYIPLFFGAKGYFSVDEKKWFKSHKSNLNPMIEYKQRRAVIGMFLYVLAYSFRFLNALYFGNYVSIM